MGYSNEDMEELELEMERAARGQARRATAPLRTRIAELEAEVERMRSDRRAAADAHDKLAAEVERRGRLIAEAEWADDGACPFEPLGGTWSTLTGPLHAPTCRAFTADGSVRWGDPEGQA